MAENEPILDVGLWLPCLVCKTLIHFKTGEIKIVLCDICNPKD